MSLPKTTVDVIQPHTWLEYPTLPDVQAQALVAGAQFLSQDQSGPVPESRRKTLAYETRDGRVEIAYGVSGFRVVWSLWGPTFFVATLEPGELTNWRGPRPNYLELVYATDLAPMELWAHYRYDSEQALAIVPGQRWTAKAGMGPTYKIIWVDMEDGRVICEEADKPEEGRRPLPIAALVERYRLIGEA